MRLNDRSRMSREVHVRFWESVGVRFPRATQLPLHRLSRIYGRDDVVIDPSTMAGWVGQSEKLFDPLVAALGRYVLAGEKVHADDTPVAVLDPGRGRTKTGRLWVYVRDDRPAGSTQAPAAWYRYSPNRKGEHPQSHLANHSGILQADAY